MILVCVILAQFPLTLDEAIQRALERAPDAREARFRQDEAQAKRASATGGLFPRLRVEAGVQLWDRPLDVTFVDPSRLPDTSTIPPPFSDLLNGFAEPVRVREQLTANVSLTAAQPLTALYPLITLRRLETREMEAQDAAAIKTSHDLTLRVIETYTQALTAEAAARIAKKGVELAEKLQERAEQLATAGLISKSEVFKAKANAANAREMQLNAQTGAELSRAALAMLVKLDPTFTLAAVDPPVRRVTLEQALAAMRDSRPELREVAARVRQAEHGVEIAWARMFPEITALANYTRTQGQKFALANQFFVGGALTWDVWEWGNKWYGIDAAKAKAAQAATALEKVEDGLALEVRQAHTRLAIAEQSIAAAKAAHEAAEDFLKNEEGRFGAGQVTATDFTLAQTNFLQAENNWVAARYRAVVAAAALDKAMGKAPSIR